MPDDDERPGDAAGAAGSPASRQRQPEQSRHAEGQARETPPDNVVWEEIGPDDEVVVPDDTRELDADVVAYHREQRTQRRREARARLLARRGAIPGLIMVSGLVMAAAVIALLTVLGPRVAQPPTKLPLAHPTTAAGKVHGLLPDVTLVDGQDRAVSSLDLRPAVLALLPLHCNCVTLLDQLAGVASSEGYGLDVIAPVAKGRDAEAAALPGRLHNGATAVLYDAAGTLAASEAASGVTVVLLDRDGTIFDVASNVAPNDRRLTALLQEMRTPVRLSG